MAQEKPQSDWLSQTKNYFQINDKNKFRIISVPINLNTENGFSYSDTRENQKQKKTLIKVINSIENFNLVN